MLHYDVHYDVSQMCEKLPEKNSFKWLNVRQHNNGYMKAAEEKVNRLKKNSCGLIHNTDTRIKLDRKKILKNQNRESNFMKQSNFIQKSLISRRIVAKKLDSPHCDKTKLQYIVNRGLNTGMPYGIHC